MGGLYKSMPVTAFTFAIGAIAMAGIPPLAGFWSKEELLAAAAHQGGFFLWLFLAISLLTAFYMTRAVTLTFLGTPREPSHAQESPLVMTGPLLLLSLGAIGVGMLGSPLAGHFLQHFLGEEAHAPAQGNLFLILSVSVATLGIALGILRYGAGVQLLSSSLRAALRPIYSLVANKYYVDEIYERILIEPVLKISRASFGFDADTIDAAVNNTGLFGLRLSALKGWIDRVIVDGAVNGIGATVARAGSVLRLIQTGLVQNYLLIAAGSTVTIFLILQWRS
jgi:NADH-quinone oxidoreductase subunit L